MKYFGGGGGGAGSVSTDNVTNLSNVPGSNATDALNVLWGEVATEATAARTMAIADSGKLIRCTSGTGCTLTIPKNSTLAIEIGTTFYAEQVGAGQIQWAPEDGTVVIESSQTLLSLRQYALIGIKKVDVDTWVSFGERQPV